MKLELKRIALRENYTIGKLSIDGKYFCDTIEDTVRDLNKNGVFDNGEVKIMHETAIPYGTYDVTLKVQSPKFSQKSFYMNSCRGYLPRLLKVPSFEGVLIHCGTDQNSSSGCIIVGQNKIKGKVINSQDTFTKLYPILRKASDKGEPITITIC